LAHEQTPLSNDTIDFVLRHREVGRAKDLSAPPHNFLIKLAIGLEVKAEKTEYVVKSLN